MSNQQQKETIPNAYWEIASAAFDAIRTKTVISHPKGKTYIKPKEPIPMMINGRKFLALGFYAVSVKTSTEAKKARYERNFAKKVEAIKEEL